MNFDKVDGLAQALFEESGDALFLFDPDTKELLDANSTAQRLSGFALWELLRLRVPEVFRCDGEEHLQRFDQAVRKTGIFHSLEGYSLRTVQDGVWVAVNLTFSRLHVKPKTLGLITARDVRPHREAVVQLQRAEAECRRVLERVQDVLWTGQLDDRGKCTYRYLSPSVLSLTGLPAEHFLQGVNRWWAAVAPEDQPVWEKAFLRLQAGQAAESEYRIVRPDGTERWVHERVWPCVDDASFGRRLDGVVCDITDRKMAEMALARCERRFDAFLNHGQAAAFLKDDEGRYVYANPPSRRWFHRDATEVVGRTDAQLFPAEMASRLRGVDAAVLSANQPLETLETISDGNGKSRAWLVIKFPLDETPSGKLLGGLAYDRG